MGRKPQGKKLKKHIYIYTEGYTEYNYFKMLNRKYNSTMSVKIKPSPVGKVGKDLLEHAIGSIRTLSKPNKALFGKAYIIFDKDKLTDKTIEEVLSEATNLGFGIGFSNECFEVWLVSHFEKPNPSFIKNTLYKKMEQYCECDGYEKNHKNDEELIKKYFENKVASAIQNCESFGSFNQTKLKDLPYTNISTIVKEIYNQSVY